MVLPMLYLLSNFLTVDVLFIPDEGYFRSELTDDLEDMILSGVYT